MIRRHLIERHRVQRDDASSHLRRRRWAQGRT